MVSRGFLPRAAWLCSGMLGKQIAEKNMKFLGLGKGEAICFRLEGCWGGGRAEGLKG